MAVQDVDEMAAAEIGEDPGWEGMHEDAPVPHAPGDDDAERARVRARLHYPRGSVVVDPDTGDKKYNKPPMKTLLNLEIIIGQDPAFYRHLGFDEFAEEVTWAGRPMRDTDETGMALLIAAVYGLHVSTDRVREVADYIARQHRYHPVREYLESLRWDGEERLPTMLSRYAGAAPGRLNELLGERWAISAVARIMQPGCKVDTTLILVGGQGAGKSSLFAAMVPESAWFSDTAMDLRHKDAYQQIQGVWLYEFAEIASLRARDAEVVKAFLSARFDKYRPPYGHNPIRVARQVVFVGTTNEAEFLDDPTGARRFWPVKIGEIDLLGLAMVRDQLWAEAVEKYREPGSRWWLTREEGEELVQVQEQYQRGDPWAEQVEGYLARHLGEGVTISELLTDALKLDMSQLNKGAQMRMAGILTGLGWAKGRSDRRSGRARTWCKVDPTSGE